MRKFWYILGVTIIILVFYTGRVTAPSRAVCVPLYKVSKKFENLECRWSAVEYVSAYAKGRKAQRILDERYFKDKWLSVAKDRVCPPMYKETYIMTDGSEKVTKKKAKKARRGRKKKSTTTEDAGIELDAHAEAALQESAPVVEQVTPEPAVPGEKAEEVAEEEKAELVPAVAKPQVKKTTAARVKDTTKDPDVEFAYEVGSRHWITRHTHMEGILIVPGTVYEVVESVPDSAPVLGGGNYAPACFMLVRGNGPRYFKLLGKHTALDRM